MLSRVSVNRVLKTRQIMNSTFDWSQKLLFRFQAHNIIETAVAEI